MNKISHNTVLYNLIKLRHLVFEVTDACNLQCKYCAYAEMYEGYEQRNNTKMSFAKVKLVIDYLQEIWEKNNYHNMEKHVCLRNVIHSPTSALLMF